jgi:RNA polymerase sigma-70 factor (ECF subfamily)
LPASTHLLPPAERVRLEGELERLRRPILAHCYRMLASPSEAEDAVQEAMLRAWRALDQLEAVTDLRPWLYRIATNVCLDALASRRRRALPMDLQGPDDGSGLLGPPLPEATWVQPIPTRLVTTDDPLDAAVAGESVRLAFVAALQHLLPRQRAVLLLRDVLRWRANEVADLLGTSVDAVNSTLRRARAALEAAQRGTEPTAGAPVDPALVTAYVEAFREFDVERIVALLHHDVVVSMPPHAFWLRGREAFAQWLRTTGVGCRHRRVELTDANGGPAVLLYDPSGHGPPRSLVLHVPAWRGGLVASIHAFVDPGLAPSFGVR